jgi:RNA polymerase sigma factor (TIGR02999 family)
MQPMPRERGTQVTVTRAGQGMLAVRAAYGADMHAQAPITELLNAAQAGDVPARDAAFALIYDELKRCARSRSRASPAALLGPTELVSEVYLRLTERQSAPFQNRQHFFALAACAMRQIMVDEARKDGSIKRGGAVVRTDLDGRISEIGGNDAATALELDAALDALAAREARLSQVVEYHFFAGLTFAEIGALLELHESTVRADWRLARAFLASMLNGAQR